MSWYSLSTSTSSVGTHRYATRHAAAPLWDFCVPCGHIRLGALFRACSRFSGGGQLCRSLPDSYGRSESVSGRCRECGVCGGSGA